MALLVETASGSAQIHQNHPDALLAQVMWWSTWFMLGGQGVHWEMDLEAEVRARSDPIFQPISSLPLLG